MDTARTRFQLDGRYTPELEMAVTPSWRGHGGGTKLLLRLLSVADTQFAAVSFNVRAENPAVRLYERAGFERVGGSESVNRTGGVSFNMVRRREVQRRSPAQRR